MKFPLVIVYNIIAFNITMIALSMQFSFPLDWHVSTVTKIVTWAIAAGAWGYSYKNRRKVINLF